MISRVVLAKNARKDLTGTPIHILKKFRKWVGDVERYGLDEVRKVPGWNDHSLRGGRQGQRAIYLNRQWRAIYVIEDDGTLFVSVVEVNPHEY